MKKFQNKIKTVALISSKQDKLFTPIKLLEIPTLESNEKLNESFEQYIRNTSTPIKDFPNDYKKAIQEIRQQQNLINIDLCIENFDAILSKCNCNKEIQTPVVTNVNQSVVEENQDDESVKSVMWQQLEANSTDKFCITPPGYNAFQQNEPHWLDKPEVSWKVLDESRLKCMRWFEEQ